MMMYHESSKQINNNNGFDPELFVAQHYFSLKWAFKETIIIGVCWIDSSSSEKKSLCYACNSITRKKQ